MRDLADELLQAQVKARLFGGDGAVKLGRLAVVARLGRGAMGTVFAAYDPQLERRVAVKLVEGAVDEARALARVVHPNVVAVHDVIDDGDGLRIVMELAPGVPLRAWMAARRPWRDVVAVMRQVAAGVAAAHEAGVLHRDIKPDNILVGDDRVRLVDFGLSGASGAAGTPAYLAPEGAASRASDQYAFGVTLFEALAGVRPEPGERTVRDVPAWLAAVVSRCLAPEPAERFTSMDGVVAALSRDARRARALGAVGLALLVGATASALVLRGTSSPSAPAPPACEGDATAVWNPTIAADVRKAMKPWGDRVASSIDTAVDAWRTSYASVCKATRVAGTQSDRLLELRMRCLDRALDRIGAFAAEVARPDQPATARASSVAVAADLPDPAACEPITDDAELAPPEDAPGEHQLARAWVSYQLGRYADARRELPAGKGRLRAEALALGAAIDARTGTPEAGRASLEAALVAAAEARMPAVELDVWGNLLRQELFGGDPARVLEWEPFARAAAARAGKDGAELDAIVGEALRDAGRYREARSRLARALASPSLRADRRALVQMNLGTIALAVGDLDGAEKELDAARGTAARLLGDTHPDLAIYDDKLAALARARGDVKAALVRHTESVGVRRMAFGDGDRSVATGRFHQAETLLEAGQLDEAAATLGRARETRVRVFGDRSARLGELDALAGDIAMARGDRPAALAAYELAAGEDPRLDLAVRRGEPIALPARDEELSIASAERTAAAVAQLAKRDPATAKDAALHLREAWRARTAPVDARLSLAVADALVAVGEDAHDETAAALAALADQPSRTRTRALAH